MPLPLPPHQEPPDELDELIAPAAPFADRRSAEDGLAHAGDGEAQGDPFATGPYGGHQLGGPVASTAEYDDVDLEAPDDTPEARFPINQARLMRARAAWEGLEGWRRKRELVRNAIAALQWGTYVDADGETIDEEEEIRDQGRIPWVMNRVRPAFRHLKGMFRQSRAELTVFPVDGDDEQTATEIGEALKSVNREEQSHILDADGFGEHAQGAFSIRKATEAWDDEADRFTIADDFVHPCAFFMSRGAADRRLKKLRIIGELHDVAPEEAIAEFCKTPADEVALREVYARSTDLGRSFMEVWDKTTGFDRVDNFDFMVPQDLSTWRIIESWELCGGWREHVYDPSTNARLTIEEWAIALGAEEGEPVSVELVRQLVGLENQARAVTPDPATGEPQPPLVVERKPALWWDFCFLSPTGHVLAQAETPYWHKKHPYSVSLNDFTDGEVFGFLLDLLDPQRQINRLFSQIDALITTSAKGLWAIPRELIPEGMTPASFAKEWTETGNILFYQAEDLAQYGGPAAIKHIQGQSVPASLFQMLTLQDQYVEKTTGMTAATTGAEPQSGTAASLYRQMVEQAATGVADLLESYQEMRQAHEKKKVQLIAQFFDQVRPVRSGPGVLGVTIYNPESVRSLDWDVAIGEVANTATLRMLFEQDAKDFLTAGYLTFPQYLTISSHPRARALLALIQQTNPLMQAGMDPATVDGIVQAAAQGDPAAIALLQQAQNTPGGQAPGGAPTSPAGQAAPPAPKPPPRSDARSAGGKGGPGASSAGR